MSTTTTTVPPAPGSDGASPPGPRRPWVRTVLAVLAVVVLAGVALAVRGAGDAIRAVPQSTEMETTLGVRFSRVAVVGDGGLVTLSYVALDVDKASRFQSDSKHPPVLRSEARNASTNRVSIMRQGHINRAGATYYFVYQNTGGALRAGEDVTIEYGGLRLEHVPVL